MGIASIPTVDDLVKSLNIFCDTLYMILRIDNNINREWSGFRILTFYETISVEPIKNNDIENHIIVG